MKTDNENLKEGFVRCPYGYRYGTAIQLTGNKQPPCKPIMLAGGIVCSFQSLDIYFVTNKALI